MEVITNKEEWNSIIKENFSKYEDTYFSYEYHEIFANIYNVELEGIFWKDENVIIFWTHLIRDVKNIEIFKNFNYFDLTTPYGYGGPLIVERTENREKVHNSIEMFFDKYKKFAKQKDYICEFIRFHPFLKNWELLKENVKIQYLNDVVFVDLMKSIEQLWRECRTDRKRNIKKTKNLNCIVNIISNPKKEDLIEFLNLYNLTMDRNKASKKYYFSYNFFDNHFNLLKDNIILANAEYNGEIIGSSIFFYRTNNIHYHLSGSKIIKNAAPSEFILWEVINWAKEKGLKKLLLGGGNAINDSLFKFKKGFMSLFIIEDVPIPKLSLALIENISSLAFT